MISVRSVLIYLQYWEWTEKEPEKILGCRMVWRNDRVVSQILIKWKWADESEALWEDYYVAGAKFPKFRFEDNVCFRKGRNVEYNSGCKPIVTEAHESFFLFSQQAQSYSDSTIVIVVKWKTAETLWTPICTPNLGIRRLCWIKIPDLQNLFSSPSPSFYSSSVFNPNFFLSLTLMPQVQVNRSS